MSLQVAAHQKVPLLVGTEGYTIQTDIYAGPLDLLLELIERSELDITRLALAQVTDQYLVYMRSLMDRDAAEVSAFLVIAARLVQIKSAALLPRPPVMETGGDETDPAETLAQQLILYRRFKQLAQWIEARQSAGLRTYLRIYAPVFKTEARLDLNGVTLKDLVRAGWLIFAGKNVLPFLSEVVNLPRVTIRERIQSILSTLRSGGGDTFQHLLKTRSRHEIIVTFLAMLELVKRHIITANQDQMFAEIKIESTGDLENDNDSEDDPGTWGVDFTE